MRVLPPTLTSAAYPADPAAQGTNLAQLPWQPGQNPDTPNQRTAIVTVLGNNVYYQISPWRDGGPSWGPENRLITGLWIFEDVAAIRFRDYTAGAHATVSVDLYEKGDPTPTSGGPIFSAGIGGINVNWYHNAALVANEPGLDFVDAASGGLTWTMADVAGTKATVQPALAVKNADVAAAAAIAYAKLNLTGSVVNADIAAAAAIAYAKLNLTGSVVNADIAAAAAIAYTKLAAGTQGGTLYNGASGVVTGSGAGTSGYVWTSNGPGADPTWAAPASVGSTHLSGALGSPVAMTSANTPYAGPSVTTTAGTWHITGYITVQIGGAGAGTVGAFINQASTSNTLAIGRQASVPANDYATITLDCYFTGAAQINLFAFSSRAASSIIDVLTPPGGIIGGSAPASMLNADKIA